MICARQRLTPRELEVFRLIAQDNTTKQLADVLFISPETVKSHRKNLLRKLGVSTTGGLIFRGFELGLLKISDQQAA